LRAAPVSEHDELKVLSIDVCRLWLLSRTWNIALTRDDVVPSECGNHYTIYQPLSRRRGLE